MKTIQSLIIITSVLLTGIAGHAETTQHIDPQLPRVIEMVKPEVPYSFIRWGVTGKVDITFQINEAGTPENIVVNSASNPVYARSVLHAVSQWRFEKPELAGAEYHLPIVFN